MRKPSGPRPAVCLAHDDLPALDPLYNGELREESVMRPARKSPQGVSDVGVDSRTMNGNAVRPRVKSASPE